VAAVTGGSPG